MATASDAVDEVMLKVRTQLASRGINSLASNGNKKLDRKEFDECMRFAGVFLASHELGTLFREFDDTGDGNITYDEFLKALKGDLNSTRLALVEAAFRELDKDGSGVVNVKDLAGVYNCTKHPEVLEGTKTEDQVLTEFLAGFEGMRGDADGNVTFDEFVDYYTEVSASIPLDAYFVTMMESAWMITLDAGGSSKELARFEDMLRKKVAERTHGAETEGHALARIFRFFDTDHTGKLTVDELGRALLQLGIPIERKLVGELMDRMGGEDDGAIDYREFSDFIFRDEAGMTSTSIL